MSKAPFKVIYGPLISEKAYSLQQLGRYTFRVAKQATKPEIARALEEHYREQKIKVREVRTLNMRGKRRRSGRRGVTGRTPNWKKAIVSLVGDQKIEGIFGGV